MTRADALRALDQAEARFAGDRRKTACLRRLRRELNRAIQPITPTSVNAVVKTLHQSDEEEATASLFAEAAS